MIANGLEKNEWKVQPDTTVQVVDPHGIKPEPFKTDRNWNGILISLAIIFSVGIMISIAAYLLVPFQAPKSHGEPLTLSMVSSGQLKASPLAAQWLSNKEVAFISESEGLLLLDIESGVTTELISDFTLRQIQVKEFAVSPNRLFILFTHNIKKGRLFKRTAKYSIYDLSKHHYYPLKLNGMQLEHPRYQHAQWLRRSLNGASEDQREKATNPYLSDNGSEIILVHKNDIYLMMSPYGTSSRITKNGKPEEVFNGVPNIMNEEIMRSSTCLWPSPDGSLIAYVSFVDSEVEKIPVIKYSNEGRPKVLFLRYPTVTSKLPKASVWVSKVETDSLRVSKWRLESPILSSSKEFYIIAVGWVHDSKLWISEVSRDQKTSHLMTCEAEEWKCSSIYINHSSEESSPIIQSVVWLGDWAAFPWPIRTPSGGWWYNHVTLVGVKGKKYPSFTLDKLHVKEVLAADSSKQVIYLLGSELSKGTETQQLYSVSPQRSSLLCISCAIKCDRIWASLNMDMTYAVITCVGTYFPTMHLVKLSEPNQFTSLHTQPQLKQVLQKTAMPNSIYKEISLSQSVHASVTLSLPPGWTMDDDSLFYPLVIQLLGIENYDEMDVVHHIGLQELLSSAHYIAHARIKFWGRDSSQIDDSIESKAHQMGNVIRNILSTHEFLDGSRISIWGWGSGASLALKLSELGIFDLKCVMAVNPVMDWKQYGSYWSERLLGSISSEGAEHRYEGSNILRSLDALNGTQIMLMQSTNDPLSHHSFGIAQHLIEKRIYFQHIVYPNSGVALRKDRTHVLKSFKTFIADHKCVKSFYH